MKLWSKITYILVTIAAFLSALPLSSMQRAATSVPRFTRQASQLAQPVLRSSPERSMKPASQATSLVPTIRPTAVQLGGPALRSSSERSMSPSQQQYETHKGKEEPKLGYTAAITGALGSYIFYKSLSEQTEKEKIAEIEYRFNELDKKLKKFTIKEKINKILKEEYPEFINIFQEPYINFCNKEDIITLFDYLNLHNKNKFTEFITNIKYVSKLTTINSIFKDVLQKWFTQNPDYFIFFLKEIEKNSNRDDYWDHYYTINFFTTFDLILSTCDILIQNPYYKKIILNLFLSIFTIYTQNPDHYKINISHFLKQSHNLNESELQKKINSWDIRTYPHLAKTLQLDSPAHRKLLSLHTLYKKQLQEILTIRNDLEKYINNQTIPSSKHLARLAQEYPDKIKVLIQSHAIDQFLQALNKSLDLTNKGYLTFFHGQQQSWALFNDIGTKLIYQLAHQDKPDDFYFLRFKEKDFKKIDQSRPYAISEIIKEQQSALKGNASGDGEDFMALNLFAFGNTFDGFSNTFNYIARKINMTPFDYMLFGDFLYKLDIPESPLFKEKFQELSRQADNIYDTGRLILIAIPADTADQWVYTYAFGKGRKKENIHEFVGNLAHYTSIPFKELDNFECIMPLTPAAALNPESDIKLFNFDKPISPEAEKKFNKAKQDFVDLIIQVLKEHGKLEESQKRAREYFALLKEVHEAEKKELTQPEKRTFFDYWRNLLKRG